MNKREIQRARDETRGCDYVTPLITQVHLDAAPVADYLYEFLQEEEMKGGYETAASRALSSRIFTCGSLN